MELIRDEEFQEGPIIKRPQDVAELMKNLTKKDREHFICIHLNTRNMVVGIEVIAIGILNACTVHPREVFKAAILNSASGIILVHNHPSGDCNPSEDDMKLTKRLVESGEMLGIEVIDHVIIGHEEFISMKDKNLL